MIIVHGPLWIYIVLFILMVILPTIIIFMILKKMFFNKHIKKQKDRSARVVSQVFIFLLALLITYLINYSLLGGW